MTSFRLFAGTDIGLRDNNEDNFTVCPDLTNAEWKIPANQQEAITLGLKGCVMVVADGMGGMNAGEVASRIAVKTVEQMFMRTKMPDDVTKKPDYIKSFLKKVIVNADLNIKKNCKEDPSTEGMGSTIVIAWLIGKNVYVAWMGDSRAYSYIPNKGLSRLSKDHSYVQELVDAKMITEEEAMLHPQSNVIIRSLGDTTQKAKPDVIHHPLVKDEVILLCSDGLCGVCSDKTIEDVIKQQSGNLRICKETLTNTALELEGSDNITIALLQIVDLDNSNNGTGEKGVAKKISWRNSLFLVFALSLLTAIGYSGFKQCNHGTKQGNNQVDSISTDTIKIDSTESDTTSKDNKDREKEETDRKSKEKSQNVIPEESLTINDNDHSKPTIANAEDSSSVTHSYDSINNNNKQNSNSK